MQLIRPSRTSGGQVFCLPMILPQVQGLRNPKPQLGGSHSPSFLTCPAGLRRSTSPPSVFGPVFLGRDTRQRVPGLSPWSSCCSQKHSPSLNSYTGPWDASVCTWTLHSGQGQREKIVPFPLKSPLGHNCLARRWHVCCGWAPCSEATHVLGTRSLWKAPCGERV